MEVDNIQITHNIQQTLEEFLNSREYSAIAVLCDEMTQEHCLHKILKSLPEHWLIQIDSGEQQKHLGTCEQIWQALTDGRFDRNSLLINLGGGVIGDMGGFVASTYKRGMDFINIPTTLLAQVDASVGGKLGIDFKGLKNHIGLFREPTQILIDATFMETLPEREIRSGFAEVLKHGLIADKSYWERCNSIDLKYHHQWNDIVERSINIKKGVVNEDPFESGLRKILNFGHTIGHAIETELLHTTDRLLHGEAIAIGMICEAYLSTKMTGLPTKALDQISTSLLELYGHQKIKKSLFNSIIKLALQDKKNKGSVIHCSLLRNIGECAINIPISGPDIIDSLFYYNQLTVHTR